MSQNENFEFFISKKNFVLVVAFSGSLNAQALPQFEKCRQALTEDKAIRFIAIDLTNLESLSTDAVSPFVQMQKNLRDSKIEFRISGMNETLKEKLLNLGVLRSQEIAKSLKDSLETGIKIPPLDPSKMPETSKKAA